MAGIDTVFKRVRIYSPCNYLHMMYQFHCYLILLVAIRHVGRSLDNICRYGKSWKRKILFQKSKLLRLSINELILCSCGMWRRVIWMVRYNVSDQLTATIFKIKNFYTESGGSGFLENFGSATLYRTKTTLHPAGLHCSYSPAWNIRVRHCTHQLKPTKYPVFSEKPLTVYS